MNRSARLVLEQGDVFHGTAFGYADSDAIAQGEIVFNTSATGYQEILTDPSYHGQIVTMAYPLIGNYGANERDVEAKKIWAAGLVVSEISEITSNFESAFSLSDFLARNKITGITGIDTRRLVRIIRSQGAQRGVIWLGSETDAALVEKAKALPSMNGLDLAKVVTTEKPYASPYPAEQTAEGKTYKVVALDYGIKQNILRLLARSGCEVTVVPAKTSASEILAMQPDGVFLSNGPGDPEPCDYAVKLVQDLSSPKLAGRDVPIFGICLGHQLVSLAFGADTYKMKFGHRGGNHPVKNMSTGQIEITSQNHGFAVDLKSLPKSLELTHLNLYDNTVAGVRHKKLPVFSVQYHPEASPGPHDSHYLFSDFTKLMDDHR